jgi:hypothetical protein
MNKEFKLNPMLLAKPYAKIRPGAYTGERFAAKKMDEMCEMLFESMYRNIDFTENMRRWK